MGKPTPGPWLYRHKNDGVYTAPPEGTNYTYGELIFAFNEDFSPSSSDLPLILAAPDLLEALEWMVAHDDTNEGDEPVESLGGQTWNECNAYWLAGLNKARRAIAKAKGESA